MAEFGTMRPLHICAPLQPPTSALYEEARESSPMLACSISLGLNLIGRDDRRVGLIDALTTAELGVPIALSFEVGNCGVIR
mmetsp:Transcript_5007/g.10931  ORF Transcript_5007/g.10931 Transcript_5007/m.10931 type:complete len:81 (+) Transcript_5007:766-1008(+)